MKLRAAGALAALLLTSAPTRARAGDLDIGRLLDRPGVKLLAVEFYATWCKQCMAAVPKWKALHEKYRREGLRLVVVATQDPQAGCVNPGWNPDEVVCDEEGVVAQALGATESLPAAFLWSWQGHLLVKKGHVEEVERAIEEWMRSAPRVDVQISGIEPGAGVAAPALRDLVRTRLRDTNKVSVLASEAERAALDRLKAESLKARYDDRLQCEIGKDLPPNTLLDVRIGGKPPRQRLQMNLLSAEQGCLVASSVVDWNAQRGSISVSEGVAELLQRLRPEVEMPRSARARAAVRAPDQDLGDRGSSWEPESGGKMVIATFASDPPGAVVLLDGNLLCQDTQAGCAKAVSAGDHTVTMQKERYQKRSERVTLADGSKVEWKLAPDFAMLEVASTPSGLEVTLDGKAAGKTPLSGREVTPGSHEVMIADRCYSGVGKRVSVAKGEVKRIDLAADPRMGAIQVTAEDDRGNALAADVRVDGTSVGNAPGTFKVPVCAQNVEVRAQGYPAWTKALSVQERQVAPITATFQRRAPEARRASAPGGGGRDNDADGIPDTLDKCPDLPEDRDGFEDEDGCPELDNDNDGVPDAVDRCVNEAETRNGYMDEDGCPDQKPAQVVKPPERIALMEQVKFEFNKAKIKPESYPVLDKLASVLLSRPEIRVLEIQGHTDNVGARDHALRLSQSRAEAVREYLIGKGVDPGRLRAKGYGPDLPIAPNITERGRAQNRRVELKILE